jgi:LemA protein
LAKAKCELDAAMTAQLLFALALVAVLVFWTLGAYNRLVSLRTAIGQTWAKVDEALRLRGQAAWPLLAGVQVPLAAEAGALRAVDAALNEATRAAQQMNAGPVVAQHANEWVAAEASLAASASRLFALIEQHAAVRDTADVVTQVTGWHEAGQRLGFARQNFNEAAQAYNQACALFPTRLLVRLFGFGPAGLI